jgi:hypothetical protein
MNMFDYKITSYSCLPDGVCISETRHNVVGDSEGEAETVGAPILECECVPLVIQHKWDS